MNPENVIITGRVMLALSWVGLIALNLYAIYWQHRYQCAFRDTAQKLYNVSIERDKLKIQNEGLKSELARVCVENEKLTHRVTTLKPFEFEPDGL